MFFGRGAGDGDLGVMLEGPSDSNVSCQKNKNGSHAVEYIPSAAGQDDVIMCGGKDIPGIL